MLKPLLRTGVLGVVSLALALPIAPALAQSGAGGCTLRKEPGGLIRGDRVPSGCVLRSRSEAGHEGAAEMGTGTVVVLPGVPIFFTPHPTFVVLENVFLRPVTPKPVVHGPTQLRRGNFGPLFRHFGPLFRHFGPIERHFGAPSSTRPTHPSTPSRPSSRPARGIHDRGD